MGRQSAESVCRGGGVEKESRRERRRRRRVLVVGFLLGGGSAHWCRAACAGTLPVLRGRVGGGSRPGCRPRDLWFLLAGPNPPSVCLCGGEAVAQLPWAPAQSFEDKMVIQSPFRYVANRWSLCDTHASLLRRLQLKHLWSLLRRIGRVAWGQIRLWMADKILDCMLRICDFFFFSPFHADVMWSSAVVDISIWFPSAEKNHFHKFASYTHCWLNFFQFSMATSCHSNWFHYYLRGIALDYVLNTSLLCVYNHILWHSRANIPTSGSPQQLSTRATIIIRLWIMRPPPPLSLSCGFGVQICA